MCVYELQMRRGGLCDEHFDASDHIVLFMAFVATASLESLAASQEWQNDVLVRLNSSDQRHPRRSKRFTALLKLAAVLYFSGLLYSIYRTSSLFHTTAENFGGWLVACLGVHVPLWLILRRPGGLDQRIMAPRPAQEELMST